ncbi:MAG: hypothetical protein LC792_25950, partial [Actinobacteria bacterium]|nr:hypothetical protein [Actinomycetota bacterium]
VMGCYALLSIAGIRAAVRARDLIISAGALLASAVAVFGSLYYSFKEAAPGAGIPGPYRAVPMVAAAVVLTAVSVALALRQWRRQTWAVMGAVFE